ncbi:hypothetical protein GCM10011521_17980 [Arenimonas soli]|uniref:Carboxypeptidase regulatory-like domain-containing protein n=1 Tax=Arenimonas soli TaxID=2269504 RepID=A0ABQ1HJ17_9GAMM|nr:hypothetical protein [Arenimonas soli]GGA80137.1 hypothetical protein GCM10011521_17980 [Arenimonas soli]
MIATVAFALGLSGAAAAGANLPPADAGVAMVEVLPAGAKPGGRGYPELAEAWWRWAFRKPDGMRPSQDPNGAHCHDGQPGDVWFLAGTSGTGPVERTCRVPEGRPLFLPVIAALEYSVPGRRRDCAALRTAAEAVADRMVVHRVELDGQPLEPVRSAPRDCFDAFADAQYDGLRPGIYAPAFTDGMWLLLPPLTPGRHRLVVDARQATDVAVRSRFDQQFTYLLEVGEAPPQESSEPSPDQGPDVFTL